jgi:hypothetical protein
MPPTIITRELPRLKHCTGVQITATIRPDFDTPSNEPALREKIKGLSTLERATSG